MRSMLSRWSQPQEPLQISTAAPLRWASYYHAYVSPRWVTIDLRSRTKNDPNKYRAAGCQCLRSFDDQVKNIEKMCLVRIVSICRLLDTLKNDHVPPGSKNVHSVHHETQQVPGKVWADHTLPDGSDARCCRGPVLQLRGASGWPQTKKWGGFTVHKNSIENES